MRWIIFAIFYIIFYNEIYSQEERIKVYNINIATSYEAVLTISENNLYVFSLYKNIDKNNIEWGGPVISKGEVTKQGKYLVLEDIYTHSKMVVDTSGHKLSFIRTFKFLQNSVLKSTWIGTSSTNFRTDVYNPENRIKYGSLISIRRVFNDTAKYRNLQYGHYFSEAKRFDFVIDPPSLIRPPLHLELIEPHYYKVYVSGLVISEGIFTRSKNILLLYDTSIKSVYHLLIKHDKLQSMLTPLDYEGVELRLNYYNK